MRQLGAKASWVSDLTRTRSDFTLRRPLRALRISRCYGMTGVLGSPRGDIAYFQRSSDE